MFNKWFVMEIGGVYLLAIDKDCRLQHCTFQFFWRFATFWKLETLFFFETKGPKPKQKPN
jgi:hypothetical protein